MPASLQPSRVHQLLAHGSATLATAESLTGGRLAALLTGTPGSSATYVGGFVTYATALKETVLGVPRQVVADYGVVSAQCATAMATGARRVTGSTYAVSTTGVAGPGPSAGIPAGTVFVGLAGPGGTHAISLNLVGSRDEIQNATCSEALRELIDLLEREVMGLE